MEEAVEVAKQFEKLKESLEGLFKALKYVESKFEALSVFGCFSCLGGHKRASDTDADVSHRDERYYENISRTTQEASYRRRRCKQDF